MSELYGQNLPLEIGQAQSNRIIYSAKWPVSLFSEIQISYAETSHAFIYLLFILIWKMPKWIIPLIRATNEVQLCPPVPYIFKFQAQLQNFSSQPLPKQLPFKQFLAHINMNNFQNSVHLITVIIFNRSTSENKIPLKCPNLNTPLT